MSITNQTYLNNRQLYSRPQAMLWSDNSGVTYNGQYYAIPSGYEYNADIPEGEAASFLVLSDHNRAPIDVTIERIEKRRRMVNGRMRSFHIADKKSVALSWSMLPSRSYYENPLFSADVPFTIDDILVETVDGVSTVTVITVEPNDYVVGDVISIVGAIPSQFNFTSVEITAVDEEEQSFAFETTTVTVVYTSEGEVSRSNSGVTSLRRTDEEYTVDGGAGAVEMLDWYENHKGPFYVFLAYDKYNNLAQNNRDGQDGYNEVLEMYITKFDYNVVQRSASGYDYWNVSVTLEEV